MLFKKLFLLAPVVLFVPATNYILDPASIYQHSQYEQRVAANLLQGKDALHFSNCDERIVQKLYIHKTHQIAEVVVLGSSRAMQITQPMFPQHLFFNSSVFAADLEDLLAIYQLYRETQKIPQFLILGLDPWILNEKNELIHWRTILEEYRAIAQDIGIQLPPHNFLGLEKSQIQKWTSLFSISYFQYCVRRSIQERFFIFKNGSQKTIFPIKRKDGSYIDDPRKTLRPTELIRQESILRARATPIDFIRNFWELDPHSKTIFEGFIKLLIDEKVHLIFYLPPYHPSAYSILIQRPDSRVFAESEIFFRAVAKKYKIPVLCSYNAIACATSDEDFSDWMHLKESAVQKIFLQAPQVLNDLELKKFSYASV